MSHCSRNQGNLQAVRKSGAENIEIFFVTDSMLKEWSDFFSSP